jgi:hypothetical protein
MRLNCKKGKNYSMHSVRSNSEMSKQKMNIEAEELYFEAEKNCRTKREEL